jgi:hypothetical protein
MWRINEEIWNKKYSLESLQSLARDVDRPFLQYYLCSDHLGKCMWSKDIFFGRG